MPIQTVKTIILPASLLLITLAILEVFNLRDTLTHNARLGIALYVGVFAGRLTD